MSDCPEASYAATFLTLENPTGLDPTRPSQTRVQTEITLASIHPGLLALYQPSHQSSSSICAPGRGALWGWWSRLGRGFRSLKI